MKIVHQGAQRDTKIFISFVTLRAASWTIS